MSEWIWEQNSVLNKVSPHVPPKEIFQAVCNELGRYYSQCGAKYTKSNRKIKWKFERIRCEMGFWSSHSNIPGEWVNLEIVTTVYALDKADMEREGLLYFHIRPNNFNVYGIDGKRFFEIVGYINETLELVRSFESAEGIRKFRGEEKFVNEHPNNAVYFNRL